VPDSSSESNRHEMTEQDEGFPEEGEPVPEEEEEENVHSSSAGQENDEEEEEEGLPRSNQHNLEYGDQSISQSYRSSQVRSSISPLKPEEDSRTRDGKYILEQNDRFTIFTLAVSFSLNSIATSEERAAYPSHWQEGRQHEQQVHLGDCGRHEGFG